MGARGWTLYRNVVMPAAVPGYVGGLQQAWALAWRALMAGELIATGAVGTDSANVIIGKTHSSKDLSPASPRVLARSSAHPVVGTVSKAPLRGSVADVIGVGAEEKVGRVAAGRVVAGVADEKVAGILPAR